MRLRVSAAALGDLGRRDDPVPMCSRGGIGELAFLSARQNNPGKETKPFIVHSEVGVSSVMGLVKYFLPVNISQFFGKSVKFGKYPTDKKWHSAIR